MTTPQDARVERATHTLGPMGEARALLARIAP